MDKNMQFIQAVKKRVESIQMPSIEWMNNPEHVRDGVQTLMDSIYGENKIITEIDPNDDDIINIRFK